MEAFAKKKGKEATRGSTLIAKENVSTLVYYRNMIFAANGIYFLFMTLMGRNYFTFDIAMFVLSAVVYITSFQFMRSMGNPTLGDNGQILEPGVDLNMEGGLAEHIKVKHNSLSSIYQVGHEIVILKRPDQQLT